MKWLNKMFILEADPSLEAGSYRLRLNGDHPVYAAHFPGHPITPGVCIVGLAAELAALQAARPLRLKGVENLKFLRPLDPREQAEICVKIALTEQPDGDVNAKGQIWWADTTFSKFSIALTPDEV